MYEDVPQKDFTVRSFLNNPTGDAGTQAIARTATLNTYEGKLLKLTNKLQKFDIVYLRSDESLYMHVKIPSETFEDFFYDIFIEFEDFDINSNSLENNRIKFFSNSPSFGFSYAHVFEMYNLFIGSLSDKYNDKIFTEMPKIRNPDYMTFYEKTITFALLYIRNRDLTTIANFKKLIRNVPISKIGKGIPSLEDKVLEYNNRKQLVAKENKAKKREIASKRSYVKKSENIKSKKSMKVNNKINNRLNTKINNKIDNKAKMKIK